MIQDTMRDAEQSAAATLELEALAALPIWQKRLRLQDWSIRIMVTRMAELGEDTLGDVKPGRTKRAALIRLLHPADVAGQNFVFDGEAWDWEITLVHELLHLHFEDCLESNWNDTWRTRQPVERAIDAIAKALVAGYRGT